MALPQTLPTDLWSVPLKLDDLPADGRSVELVADAQTRARIASAGGLVDLQRLEAQFDVQRQGDGARVRGTVSATVRQTCVVTLDPIDNDVREDVDIVYHPPTNAQLDASEEARAFEDADPPEPLRGDTVDLGALAVEFLLLGIDPYPRKSDAVFDAPAPSEPKDNAFAALAALKQQLNRKE